MGGAALAVTGAVWFLTAHDPGTRVDRQSEASASSTNRADEPRVTVPLWGDDGMGEVSAVANTLHSDWHRPTEPLTADPWFQQTQELQQRLAQLLSQVESSVVSFPAEGTGKSQKE